MQAGGAGIELQYNSIVVFFSPTWSYQDYEQAMGRAYRNGQKNKVTVYQFITENTIEEKVYKSLKIKKDFSMHLLNKEDLGGLE
ncbi:helicase-related protein [Fusobacterium necrophorum]|uniref:helicase-related protein n=1 Tax=Fusobacterium necrophorum TaxID=859 RepID=UPI00373AEBA9